MGCRCCGACFTAQGNKQFEVPCCKCIPKRICVAIYPPEALTVYCNCSDLPADDPYGPRLRMTLELDCTGQRNTYTGSFTCGTTGDNLVDLSFRFEREEGYETGYCYFVLTSEALGYIYTPPTGTALLPTDDRLKVTMGGAYGTGLTTRAEECISGGPFEFTLDLSRKFPDCGNARVVVNAADYMAQPDLEVGTGTGVRPCSCSCLKVYLTKDGVETEVKSCYDEYAGSWSGTFDRGSIYEQYNFTIYEEAAYGTAEGSTLTLISDLGNGAAQTVTCSNCAPRFSVTWELPYNVQIRAICARPNECPYCSLPCDDCKCFCRCVCVIYSSEVDNVATVVQACWDEYNYRWSADVGSRTLHFNMRCDNDTGITMLHLTDDYGATLGIDADSGGGPKAANCPDISASWSITEYGGALTTIAFACDNCGHCSNLVQTPCCDEPVPAIIYATVTGVHSCWQYVMDPDPVLTTIPTLVIPLILYPAVGAGTPYWEGTRQIDGYLLDKKCNIGTPGTPSYIKMTIRVLCGIEIDSVYFTCYGPDNSFAGGIPQGVVPLTMYGNNTCAPVYITAKLGEPDPISGYMVGGVNLFGTTPCRPDGSGGDDRGYFFEIVVTE